jgi:hypothetical protein
MFGFDLFRNQLSQITSTSKQLTANWQIVEERLEYVLVYVLIYTVQGQITYSFTYINVDPYVIKCEEYSH